MSRHVLRRAVVQQYIVDPVLYQLLGWTLMDICLSVIAQRMLDQMDNHRIMLMPLQYPLHTSIIGKLMNNVTKHTETIRNYIDPGGDESIEGWRASHQPSP